MGLQAEGGGEDIDGLGAVVEEGLKAGVPARVVPGSGEDGKTEFARVGGGSERPAGDAGRGVVKGRRCAGVTRVVAQVG